MQLLRCRIRYFTGTTSAFLQKQMGQFTPYYQQDIHQILKQLYPRRQYIPYYSPVYEIFIHKIQKFYLNRKQFTRQTIRNYYKLQEMELLTYSMRSNLSEKVAQYLKKDETQANIKNQRLENLLWWFYRQFPYKNRQFNQILQCYNLRLYQLHQYMSNLPKLPIWQPFIRISTLLHILGHCPAIRQDMISLQTIQSINPYYYYHLSKLFTPEQYDQIKRKLNIQNHFLQYLTDKFFMKDSVQYDQYLQRIQIIDNVSANQEINRTLDVASWIDLQQAFRIAIKAYQHDGINEMHDHKLNEMFWRKLQTCDIPLQSSGIILGLLTSYPNYLMLTRSAIINRICQSILSKQTQQIQLIPSQGYIKILNILQYLPIDRLRLKQLKQFLLKQIGNIRNWEEDDVTQVMQILQRMGEDKLIGELRIKLIG